MRRVRRLQRDREVDDVGEVLVSGHHDVVGLRAVDRIPGEVRGARLVDAHRRRPVRRGSRRERRRRAQVAGVRSRVAEGRLADAVDLGRRALDLAAVRVAVGASHHLDAVGVAVDEALVVLVGRRRVGSAARLRSAPARRERRPGRHGRHRRLPGVHARIAPVAEAAHVRGDLDVVGRRAGHRVPGDQRRARVEHRGQRVEVGRRVGGVVAHVQVRDRRRDRVEVLLEDRRVGVPDAGVAVRVDRPHAPVVGLRVREDVDRRVGRAEHVAVTADLRAGGEVRRVVRLDLVLHRARDGVPGEDRVEDRRRRRHVHVGRRRPRPGERADDRADALVQLGVLRHDGPVVAAGRERTRDRVRGRARLDRLAAVGHREGAERRVGRDVDQVLVGAGHRRPAQHERRGRVRALGSVARGLRRRLGRPRLAQGARLRPGTGRVVHVQRADVPVVRAVRQRLVGCSERVQRLERGVAIELDRRVEAGVGRQLELVVGGVLDRLPGEGGDRVGDRALGGRNDRRRREPLGLLRRGLG